MRGTGWFITPHTQKKAVIFFINACHVFFNHCSPLESFYAAQTELKKVHHHIICPLSEHHLPVTPTQAECRLCDAVFTLGWTIASCY